MPAGFLNGGCQLRNRIRSLAIGGIASTIMVSGLTPALASTTAGIYRPHGRSCPAHYEYDVSSTAGDYHHGVGPTFKDYNGGSKGVNETFTATVSASASVTVSVSGSFDIDAIVAGASATAGISLSASVTLAAGTTASVYTPSKEYGEGQYGVWEWETTGSYYYVTSGCAIQDKKTITTKVPENASGWDTWVSKT
jgi:hypothetical protein